MLRYNSGRCIQSVFSIGNIVNSIQVCAKHPVPAEKTDDRCNVHSLPKSVSVFGIMVQPDEMDGGLTAAVPDGTGTDPFMRGHIIELDFEGRATVDDRANG